MLKSFFPVILIALALIPPVKGFFQKQDAAAGAPCLFDFERGEVSNCILESATGDLFVARQYLKKLSFNSQGLAAVHSSREGWMYVNRKGKAVIRGVPAMDNGADLFHDGLVRFIKGGKYGFANSKGHVVISPVYDGAMNFEKGRAEVCQGCQSRCADSSCEYHLFSGGQWFRIDTKGNILTQLPQRN